MKKMYLFAAFAAAFAFLACTKEMAAPEQNEGVDEGLVPFSFYATVDNSEGEDSKVFINTETGKVNWKSGDKLSVFDNADNYATNHVFTANTDGDAVSFDGSLNAGFANFTAIYPYSEGIVYASGESNPIAYDIPVIQEAVKGSFDPKAARYVATGTNLSSNLSFKAAFALLKVNVDVDDVVALYVENTSRDMSGSVSISTGAGVGNGTGTRYRRITLKKSDDSVLEQGDYYIVVRFLNPDKPDEQMYSNFKLTYIKEDASCLTRAASENVLGTHVARGTVANLGRLSSFTGTPAVSWFTYYQAGLDVKIGSKTINRFTEGDAELWTANNSTMSFNKTKLESGGIYFLNAVGTGSFELTNSPSLSNRLVLLSNGATPAPLSIGGASSTKCALTLAGGDVYLKSLNISNTVNSGDRNYFFTVGSAVTDSFVVDGCLISQINQQYFINGSVATNGITNVEIINCRLAIGKAGGVQFINISKTSTGIGAYKSFVFNNNYVYSTLTTATPNIPVQIFNHSIGGSDTPVAEAQLKDMGIEISNNLFYNTVAAGNFKHFQVKKIVATKNLFWINDATDLGSNVKLVSFKDENPPSSGSVTDNICFGVLGNSRKWSIADSKHRGTIMTNMSTPEATDPIASSDVAVGTFTMAAGYEVYGPQGI